MWGVDLTRSEHPRFHRLMDLPIWVKGVRVRTWRVVISLLNIKPRLCSRRPEHMPRGNGSLLRKAILRVKDLQDIIVRLIL